jgi:hypothetical protein
VGRHYESVVFFRYCSLVRSGCEKGFGVHGRANTRLIHDEDSLPAELCGHRTRARSGYTCVYAGAVAAKKSRIRGRRPARP